jgi:hypothetical protein
LEYSKINRKMSVSDHECPDLTSPRGKQAASGLGDAYKHPGKVVEKLSHQVYSSTLGGSDPSHCADSEITGSAAEGMRSSKESDNFCSILSKDRKDNDDLFKIENTKKAITGWGNPLHSVNKNENEWDIKRRKMLDDFNR